MPGYVVSWRAGRTQDGLPVMEVEPITDMRTRERLRKIIREKEHVTQTEFW